MSKSGPLEQMVLEAGDQPLYHLNLDNRARRSEPPWVAKEFAQGITKVGNLSEMSNCETLIHLRQIKNGK